ncbi:transketolase [Sorangium sp. So ce1014]|uniref:transketolase n=1 Tax=Sorangium sp. So ce1014 TaxID=3133326 RepID=UPI003F5D80DA
MAGPDGLGSPPDPAAVIAHVEVAAGSALFAAHAAVPGDLPIERAASAAEAIRGAAARTRAGQRASVVLGAHELVGALAALGEAAAVRTPVTVHVIERRGGLAVGRDELAPALDVGAGVLVTWSSQEAADVALVARRAAEDSETPFLHVVDALPSDVSALGATRDLAARFLGPERSVPTFTDAAPGESDGDGGPRPQGRGVVRKRAERSFCARVPFALASAMRELCELTGRPLGAIERVDTADAEEIMVVVGCAFPAAREVVRSLRAQGRRVGLVGVRALRPFYGADVVKTLGRAKAIVVLEPLDVPLAPQGHVAALVKAAFADALTWAPGFPGVGRIPPILSATFATIDGTITERDVRLSLAEIASGERARRHMVFGSDG